MPGRDRGFVWAPLLALAVLLAWSGRAMAYVGPGAGLELIPYFFGLLMWVVIAFVTLLLWPVFALVRLIRGSRGKADGAPAEAIPEQTAAPVPAERQ